jgi:branched-chain amino acid transport system substrate-binding protein
MKKRSTAAAAAAVLAFASMVAVAPSSNAAPKTVTLAFQGPLSGDYAQLGVDQFPGAQFAVAQYNATKPATRIKLIKADSQCSGDVAANVAPGVAQNSAVIGVIGTSCSGEARNSVPFYKARGLTMVSPSATAVDLTDPNSKTNGVGTFFRVVVNDATQGPALARYATQGVSNAQIFVVDDKSPYGAGLAASVKAAITKSKLGKIAGEDSVIVPLPDWTSVVNKVKSVNANVVIFTGYDADAAKFFKALRDDNYKGILAGGDGVNTSAFPDLAGSAAEGVRMTAPDVPFDRLVSKKTLKAFTDVTGVKIPGLYVTSAYDSANVFIDCIKKGNVTRANINKCVSTGTFKGVGGGNISFDQFGDVKSGAAVGGYTVKDGVIIYDKKL